MLTELNVAPAQLYPNSWAFARAFARTQASGIVWLKFWGTLLFASNQALARTQASKDLEAKMAKHEEDFAARAKVFANHETDLYLEVASLRQIEKDVKKALQDKS